MRRIIWVNLIFGLILTGCSVLGADPNAGQPTPTALPTTDPDEGLRVSVSTACLVRSFPTIQVDPPAGDLMGWSPDGQIFAYIAPFNNQWGWYTGNLTLLSMETGEIRATRDTKVTGDITWSPDGNRIAFTALRTTENLYTIIVLLTADFTPLDLYAAGAATDDFGSAKGIARWTDNSHIQVDETCGVDCSRVVEISVFGQGQQVLQTGRKQDDLSLEIVLDQTGFAANPDWLLANASPDGSRIFYVDNDDQAWLAAPDEGYKYRLPLDLGFVQESKWSPDSQLIAVRTNENIYLYDLDCSLDLPE
ncbi:MAG: hypothetical protein WA109_00420 [Bellilinea sp.]